MKRVLFVVVLCVLVVAPAGSGPAVAETRSESDLAAARVLFEANLKAIRQRDGEAYLACYLASERLVRTGPEGFSLGFEGLAAGVGEGWPDRFDAQALRLAWIRPGLVYGTYRYRVRYGEDEVTGLSERFFVETTEGWRIAVSSAFPDPPDAPPPALALLGATLVDGTGAPPVPNAAVVLREGKIECAGSREACPVPEAVEAVDLAGHWITPGLVDAHVHFSQTGWADGRPDALDVRDRYPYEEVQAELRRRPERWFRSYLCAGVTAVFDNGGYPWTWTLSRRAEADTSAPHVAAAGPLLSTLDFWLNLPAERQFVYLADEAAARTSVDYLASHGTDAVKVWYVPAPDRDRDEMDAVVLAAGRAAREHGLPLIVHATDLREAKVALRAGARLLVHSVWDQPVDDELVDMALANGAVYCPTLTVGSGYQRLFEAAAQGTAPSVDDPNGCLDRDTRARLAETSELTAYLDPARRDPEWIARRARTLAERERISALNLERLHDAGVTIAMGTDAGNPLTVAGPSVYAEMEAMQAAGLTPSQVLMAATRGGAIAMGRNEEIGTVEAGKIADLLVLSADPIAEIANMRQLRWVVRGGELREAGELRGSPVDHSGQR